MSFLPTDYPPAIISQHATPDDLPELGARVEGPNLDNKPRLLVGWRHQNDTPAALQEGRLWCWVVSDDRFFVYDETYNRSTKPGVVRFCGVANFTMVRMFHPWFAIDGYATPKDMNSSDKKWCRRRYREAIQMYKELQSPQSGGQANGNNNNGEDATVAEEDCELDDSTSVDDSDADSEHSDDAGTYGLLNHSKPSNDGGNSGGNKGAVNMDNNATSDSNNDSECDSKSKESDDEEGDANDSSDDGGDGHDGDNANVQKQPNHRNSISPVMQPRAIGRTFRASQMKGMQRRKYRGEFAARAKSNMRFAEDSDLDDDGDSTATSLQNTSRDTDSGDAGKDDDANNISDTSNFSNPWSHIPVNLNFGARVKSESTDQDGLMTKNEQEVMGLINQHNHNTLSSSTPPTDKARSSTCGGDVCMRDCDDEAMFFPDPDLEVQNSPKDPKSHSPEDAKVKIEIIDRPDDEEDDDCVFIPKYREQPKEVIDLERAGKWYKLVVLD